VTGKTFVTNEADTKLIDFVGALGRPHAPVPVLVECFVPLGRSQNTHHRQSESAFLYMEAFALSSYRELVARWGCVTPIAEMPALGVAFEM
jgi:hypothetical protein